MQAATRPSVIRGVTHWGVILPGRVGIFSPGRVATNLLLVPWTAVSVGLNIKIPQESLVFYLMAAKALRYFSLIIAR